MYENTTIYFYSLCVLFFFHVDPPHPVIYNQRGPSSSGKNCSKHSHCCTTLPITEVYIALHFQLIKSDYVIIHQSILCDDPPPALLNPTTCLFNSYFLGLQFVVLTVFHTCQIGIHYIAEHLHERKSLSCAATSQNLLLPKCSVKPKVYLPFQGKSTEISGSEKGQDLIQLWSILCQNRNMIQMFNF